MWASLLVLGPTLLFIVQDFKRCGVFVKNVNFELESHLAV